MRKLTVLLVSLVLISACSCGKRFSDKTLGHIPKDASFVAAFNVKNLLQKADQSTLKNLKAVQAASMDNVLKTYLENPAESGIDIERNAYAFFTTVNHEFDNFYGAVLVPLKDKAKFAAALQSQEIVPVVDGNINVVEDRFYFNDELIIVPMGDNTPIKQLFDMTSKESIADNKSLQKFLAENHDLGGWINTDPIAENFKTMPGGEQFLALAGLKQDMLPGTTITFYNDFENGEIVSGSNWDLNPKLKAITDKFFNDKVTTDFGKYFPKENLGLVMTAAFSPSGVKSFLESGLLLMMSDAMVRRGGLTTTQLLTMFQGDIALGVYPNNGMPRNPNVLFAAKVADKASVEKFIKSLSVAQGYTMEGGALLIPYEIYPDFTQADFEEIERNGQVSKKKGKSFVYEMPPATKATIYMWMQDDMFFISSLPNSYATIKAGGYAAGTTVEAATWQQLTSHIVSISSSSQTFAYSMMPPEIKNLTNGSDGYVDRTGGITKMHFVDKSKNSLRLILEAMDALYVKEQGNNPVTDDVNTKATLDKLLEE